MFDLPEIAYINKPIPKTKFLQNANNKIKKEFLKLEKIIWLYNISPKTINIDSSENIQETQIFKIILKEKTVPKNQLLFIQKLIPYPILFFVTFEDEYFYAIFDKNNFFYSNWNEEKKFNFNANSLKEIYENLIKSFLEVKEEDFSKSLELQNKINALKKEIVSLEAKIKKEKQFKYKVELNKKLLECKKELERLKNC